MRRVALIVAAVVAVLLAVAAGLFAWHLYGARPRLEGEVRVAGLSAPVTIVRDAAGVPTITAATRADAGFALGYLHAQERFFEMDGLRRAAAGELSALFGPATAAADRRVLLHRFRSRARAIVAAATPGERAMLARYAAGVNWGLDDLAATPFEYLLLRATPVRWRPEDTVLAVFAMYIDLQSTVPRIELFRATAERRGGRGLADLLYPSATPLDTPIDGSTLPPVALPARLVPQRAPAAIPAAAEAAVPGSNNWAVAGRLSTSGGALVANDMHLAIRVPGIWYRARIRVPAAGLDVTGVTLPGNPTMVAGSNGRIAWGFTNSYIDTSDAVVVEPVAGRPGYYRTPQGPRPIQRVAQSWCVHADCRRFTIDETIWGPIVAHDAFGRRIAMRWTAHDPGAVRLAPAFALEAAGSVAEALQIAHRSGIPQQNLVVGDRSGAIGWTIAGQVPRRFGFDGRDATSWADGRRGWRGHLDAGEVPTIVNPPAGRLWTANARVVGGAEYARLGDGGYDTGSRAGRIRERLFAADRFGPRDFLAIQLDTTSLRNRWWQRLMLGELRARASDPRLAAMIAPIAAWDGRAETASVGYRLIARFRRAALGDAYGRYMGGKPPFAADYTIPAAEGTLRALLTARPAALVPPGRRDWAGFVDAALRNVAEAVTADAGGDLDAFTWGVVSPADVHHPLARSVPGLGWLTDPADQAMPGDSGVVRAQGPGFGASERFAVSPGHEAEGLFHMPSGQSGNPVSPYYLSGHRDWVEGRAAPFLPAAGRWTLRMVP
ncbi:penicillin acylase family protein [Sphingomonas sp. KR1UV-12]|uniref:Penicillin acylase family protein n=1 Tax=Sphingomonas aurea TaxID=3063994 RepID=A0ABT9EN32_9SPHN|nr:penicillin acylase family protein [Sphingomonas sp. KR1UV-12]MDP1028368.1 penicillin acylase family protein [Sphingomonas sp. KR1UV-12]